MMWAGESPAHAGGELRDAVYALAVVALAGVNFQPQLLADGRAEESTNGVRLPVCCFHQAVERCAVGPLQHLNHFRFLASFTYFDRGRFFALRLLASLFLRHGVAPFEGRFIALNGRQSKAILRDRSRLRRRGDDAKYFLLDAPGQFRLAVQLDHGVFLGHPGAGVAGDARRLDTRSANFLSPRDVGAAQGVEPEAREIAAFQLGGVLQSLAHTGIPHRLLAIVLREHPRIRRRRRQRSNPIAHSLDQAAQRQRALASFRFWIVDVTAPMPLLDSDARLVEIDVLHLQAGHLGNARAGSEANLADESVGVLKTIEHADGLLFRENPL